LSDTSSERAISSIHRRCRAGIRSGRGATAALALDPRSSPPARLKRGVRALLLAAVIPPQMASGAIITLAPYNLYPLCELCSRAFSGIAPLQDQTFGGLMLWIPSTMMSLVGALFVLATWFRSEQRSLGMPPLEWRITLEL